jgi:transposase
LTSASIGSTSGSRTHALRRSPAWRDNDDLLKEIPGVGSLTRATMLGLLPELGTLSRRRIAAFVGVAPFNRDSGKQQGQRVIWGGRAQVRRTLYMATVAAMRCNPVIRSFYDHLRTPGKARQGGPRGLHAKTLGDHECHAQTSLCLVTDA